MFWRLGSVEDSRPVVAVVWLNVVCRRPSLGEISGGSASRYVEVELRQLAPALDLGDDPCSERIA